MTENVAACGCRAVDERGKRTYYPCSDYHREVATAIADLAGIVVAPPTEGDDK